MNERTLHVRVGDSADAMLSRASDTMKALERGETPVPRFEVGFANVGQMFAVFTPRRWELLATLREAGAVSIAALARLLGRDYKNVHGDVMALIEWMLIEREQDGRVCAPYSEIVIDVRLPERRAA
ncbi:hypothetical protein [Paracandidimonas soli]|uniref:Putative transcriptional regulator n=1 Tax=Paracandidimonas soli TaxID=1917182 RepID=A0A4R3UZ02_9BURK|nr:hypothetical protein [Paracandidimonas soli]TCU96008.1 putative transcriptional regulator [Paracandidimonas soli]